MTQTITTTPPSAKVLGNYGEKLAASYLQKKGYQLLETNYYMPGGEIDLIVQKDDILVFVEVKTRLTENFGPAEAALTPYKRFKFIRAVSRYLHEKSLFDKVCQLDLIAIQLKIIQKKATIKHFSHILTL